MGHAKSGRTHQNLCGWRKSQKDPPLTSYLTSLNLLNMNNKYDLLRGLTEITKEEGLINSRYFY